LEVLIAQISDSHVSLPGRLIDRAFHTSEHLARAVAHLNGLDPRPDVVLHTGDIVDHGLREEYERAREILAGLAMPLYVIPGNHDDRAALRAVFARDGYLPRAGDFLQYVVEDLPIRLVALDTLVPQSAAGRLCAQRLAWLDAQLSAAPSVPTMILMHHPPFVSGLTVMDETMGLEGIGALAAIVRRHPQVERVASGHLHRPMLRRFAGTVASVCPSTAHQLGLDLPPQTRLTVTEEPPGAMLHVLLDGGAGLVSHLSVIGSYPTYTVFADGKWLPIKD
jgi:3',5'-cyclic AMP phosphodiesterase CpdA